MGPNCLWAGVTSSVGFQRRIGWVSNRLDLPPQRETLKESLHFKITVSRIPTFHSKNAGNSSLFYKKLKQLNFFSHQVWDHRTSHGDPTCQTKKFDEKDREIDFVYQKPPKAKTFSPKLSTYPPLVIIYFGKIIIAHHYFMEEN